MKEATSEGVALIVAGDINEAVDGDGARDFFEQEGIGLRDCVAELHKDKAPPTRSPGSNVIASTWASRHLHVSPKAAITTRWRRAQGRQHHTAAND